MSSGFAAPSTPDQKALSASPKVYLKGVVLLGEDKLFQKGGVNQASGFEARGLHLPGGVETLKKQLEPLFLGRAITGDLLMALRSHIVRYYLQLGQSQPSLYIPVQDFSSGVLQIIVSDASMLTDEEKADLNDRLQPSFTESESETDGLSPPTIFGMKEPILAYLKTLILTSDARYLNDLSSHCFKQSIYLNHLAIPGSLEELQKTLEPLYLNQPLTQEMIQELKKEIIRYYYRYNRPVVVIEVPEQEITDGVLRLVIIEGRLGRVSVQGNRYFSDGCYRSAIKISQNSPILTTRLMADISWLNRNPFRSVDAYFTPGLNPGETDIILQAKEKFPVQLYVGGDNTGNDATGNARWFAGFTWGNAFWLDQVLSYQFTTATDPRHYKSHTVHYKMPLRWRHYLIAYGGYAVIRPKVSTFEMKKGHNFQASVRYLAPVGIKCEGYVKEFTLGFDYKNTDNNFVFVGEEDLGVFTGPINISQFVGGFAYASENAASKYTFDLDLYYSPGELLKHETKAEYDELTPGARSKYIYGRLMVNTRWYLPHRYSIFLQTRLQLASNTLLPSERYGLGGYDTVRGYLEREYNADNALNVNFEIWTRPVKVLKFFNVRCVKDELSFLAFLDYGLGNVLDRSLSALISELGFELPKFQNLLSAGPGLRYTINDHLSMRIDWGIKLHRTVFSDSARSKFHVGLIGSF